MAKGDKEQPSSPINRVEDRIESTLLDARRIFLSDAVDGDTAKEIIRKIWYLELTDPGKPILFVINSPGGSIDAGFAIWDQIQMITSPVITLVTGLAASMASILSIAPKKPQNKELRCFATENARFMIHQPRLGGSIQGQATDLDIQAKEMLKTWAKIVEIYVKRTGKDPKVIERAIDRDTWMSAQEALEFGLLDGIVGSFKDLPVK